MIATAHRRKASGPARKLELVSGANAAKHRSASPTWKNFCRLGRLATRLEEGAIANEASMPSPARASLRKSASGEKLDPRDRQGKGRQPITTKVRRRCPRVISGRLSTSSPSSTARKMGFLASGAAGAAGSGLRFTSVTGSRGSGCGSGVSCATVVWATGRLARWLAGFMRTNDAVDEVERSSQVFRRKRTLLDRHALLASRRQCLADRNHRQVERHRLALFHDRARHEELNGFFACLLEVGFFRRRDLGWGDAVGAVTPARPLDSARQARQAL